MRTTTAAHMQIDWDGLGLEGDLAMPAGADALVIFAHGSGGSRFSRRNRAVAATLQQAGLGTLLLDLLTCDGEAMEMAATSFRFDIALLAARLIAAIDWAGRHPTTSGRRVGLFGASTGAAVALLAAGARPATVGAIVSRGGRLDLVVPALGSVKAPTLLIVGGADQSVIELNRRACDRLACERHLEIIPGATHLFEEAGALDEVARLAAAWFTHHLSGRIARSA